MKIKCIVFRRPNLRSYSVEMESYIGKLILDNLFGPNPTIDESIKELFFSFPERWLNILEQRALISRIKHYYPKCEYLEFKTHSVYIIQTMHHTDVRVHNTESVLEEHSSLTELLYDPTDHMDIFNEKGLTVL